MVVIIKPFIKSCSRHVLRELFLKSIKNQKLTTMKIYKITFYDKKTKKEILSVHVEAEGNLGILLKGKVKATLNGFLFNNKKHTCSYSEI